MKVYSMYAPVYWRNPGVRMPSFSLLRVVGACGETQHTVSTGGNCIDCAAMAHGAEPPEGWRHTDEGWECAHCALSSTRLETPSHQADGLLMPDH